MILVTGATGFVGGRLAEVLVQDGESVRVMVRDVRKSEKLKKLNVEIVEGNLKDPSSLEKALDGVTLVYHIAATFREANLSDEEMWAVNSEGVKNILDAAIACGTVKRLVHCSTIGVHGHIENPPADEDAPFAPGDVYQESKLGGEKIATEYMNDGKLPISIFRPGGIYGPGDMRFLKLFKSIKKGRFLMIGSGKVLYTLIYIDDLVRGIKLCGTHENAPGNIFILTGDPPLTLAEMVKKVAVAVGAKPSRLKIPVTPVYIAAFFCEMICKPFGISPPLFRRRVDFFRKDRAFDVSKARNLLGFQAEIPDQEGLDRTAAWYKENNLL